MAQRRLVVVAIDWSKVEVRDAPEMSVLFERRRKPRIVAATCANCEQRFGLPRCRRSPFCSPRCRDLAKYVRYARAKRREYDGEPPLDIQYALYIKRVHALGEGYNDSARRVSGSRRQQVWMRDGGLCVECGGPGEEIDHIDGPSDDLDNLRLLCPACHHQKTAKRIRRTTDLPTVLESALLETRALAPEPMKACDADGWQDVRREWYLAHVEYDG